MLDTCRNSQMFHTGQVASIYPFCMVEFVILCDDEVCEIDMFFVLDVTHVRCIHVTHVRSADVTHVRCALFATLTMTWASYTRWGLPGKWAYNNSDPSQKRPDNIEGQLIVATPILASHKGALNFGIQHQVRKPPLPTPSFPCGVLPTPFKPLTKELRISTITTIRNPDVVCRSQPTGISVIWTRQCLQS